MVVVAALLRVPETGKLLIRLADVDVTEAAGVSLDGMSLATTTTVTNGRLYKQLIAKRCASMFQAAKKAKDKSLAERAKTVAELSGFADVLPKD